MPEFLFAKPQQLTKGEVEKVLGLNEKSPHLLPKKIWYVVALLALCTTPTSFKMPPSSH